MSTWQPKIGRHVTYYKAGRKPRPATITGVVSATVLNLRVGRHGETYASVPIETPSETPFSNDTVCWTRLGR